MPYGVHRPSSTDSSNTLVGQTLSLVIGIVVTVLFGFQLVKWSFGLIFSVVGQLILFVIALYFVMVAIRYFLSKSYMGSMSLREVAWLFFVKSDKIDDTKSIPRVASLAIGAVITFFALFMLVQGVMAAFSVIFSALLLAVLVYLIGVIGWFWLAGSWKDGVTENEVRDMLTWPVAA